MRTVRVTDDEKGKGRVFQGVLLAHATADALWENGSGGDVRPVYAAIAASEGEAAPLLANLRLGRKAAIHVEGASNKKPPEMEFLRSAQYHAQVQRFVDVGADGRKDYAGAVIQLYQPDLFRLDPGMIDPQRVALVALPEAAHPHYRESVTPSMVEQCLAHLRAIDCLEEVIPDWRREKATAPDVATACRLIPMAQLVAVMLGRRVRAPLIDDPRFFLQVLVAMLRHGLASLSSEKGSGEFGVNPRLGYFEQGVEDVGLAPGVAVLAKHEELEKVLAVEVASYYMAIGGKGKKAAASDERAALELVAALNPGAIDAYASATRAAT